MTTSKMLSNSTGRVSGRVVETDEHITYFAANGTMAGRYIKANDTTVDSRGRFYGRGDQGMSALCEYANSRNIR